MKTKLATLIATILLSTSAQAFDFKGIELNRPATKEEIQSKLYKSRCMNPAGGGITCFSTNETIAGKPAQVFVEVGEDGLVRTILVKFNSSDFDLIEEAAIGKYGTPTDSAQNMVSTAMGATYENRIYKWTDEEGSVVILKRYSGKITEGAFWMNTEKKHEEYLKERESNKKDM